MNEENMRKSGRKKSKAKVGVPLGFRWASCNDPSTAGVVDMNTKFIEVVEREAERMTSTNAAIAGCKMPDYADNPETILEEAERITSTDRPMAYDHPEGNFGRLGKVWAVILGHEDPIQPETVALMMAAHKLVREAYRHQRDNLVDLAGYTRCIEKIMERRGEK